MAVSVLRRYTPPTFTLEIMADQSPLSRWSRQPILRNVRFRLAIDGPHLSSNDHVRIQGDRHQLELLCDVVDAYNQQILSQSLTQFQTTLFRSLPGVKIEPSANSMPQSKPSKSVPSTQIERGRSLVPPDVMASQRTPRPSMPDGTVINQTGGMGIVIPSGLAILPCGKLKHEIWWGTLATKQSGVSTTLGTIELFDLANALGQYKSDHLLLPEHQHRAQKIRPWMQAAAVVVLAVGTTTAIIPAMQRNFLYRQVPSDTQVAAENESFSDQDDLSAAPQSREEIGLPESFRERSLAADRARQTPQGNIFTNDDEANNTENNESRASEQNESGQQRANPSATIDESTSANRRTVQDIPPELAAIPPIDPRISQAEERIQQLRESDGAIASEDAPVSSTTRLQSPSSLAPEPSVASSGSALDPTVSDFSRRESPSASASNLPSGSLPQVDEVRSYFQHSWQPPEDLERPLEYQLILNADGTLAEVTPLGQTSRLYARQANIPAIGNPFVSPLDSPRQPTIRLVLQPNGQVRAFLESWN